MFNRFSRYMVLVVVIAGGVVLTAGQRNSISCSLSEIAAQQVALNSLVDRNIAQYDEKPENTLSSLYQIGNQYRALATNCGYTPEDETMVETAVDDSSVVSADNNATGPSNLNAEASYVALFSKGDAESGEALFWGYEPGADGNILGCISCHGSYGTAPPVHLLAERAVSVVSTHEDYRGSSTSYFLTESILNPAGYVDEAYANIMPGNFGNRLTVEQIADLVAYLNSFTK